MPIMVHTLGGRAVGDQQRPYPSPSWRAGSGKAVVAPAFNIPPVMVDMVLSIGKGDVTHAPSTSN
jgi:hypothetical protein